MLVQECITPAGSRDAEGRMVVDPIKFPFGFKSLCDYFHSKGLLCGIYTDVAHLTCANFEGSGPGPSNPAGHWPLDALTFASWGVDMIEADFCNTGGLNLTALQLYEGARDAIAAATAATGQRMALYQCNWGDESPWLWGPTVANLFRNTGDICSPGSIAWSRILSNCACDFSGVREWLLCCVLAADHLIPALSPPVRSRQHRNSLVDAGQGTGRAGHGHRRMECVP